MKPFIRPVYVLVLFAGFPRYAHAQCGAAPIAAAACSGGNGAATSGVNINSGNTYWVNSSTTLASVNLNSGGTLRVCGSLTISTLNYNGGNLIVENGGTLNISALGSTNLNGSTVIINRGTINITPAVTITFQNSGNYIYNDLTTSVLNIAGNVTVNSGGLTLINRGIMSIAGTFLYQGAAGTTTTGVCLGPQSVTTIYNLSNVTTNSFAFSGAGVACLNVTHSATLTDAVTSSSSIHVCLAGGATVTGVGGWGSAQVTSGCSSCATVLPLGITDLTAMKKAGSVQLHWLSGVGTADNGVYYAEKSTDGVNFETFASVDADASDDYTVSDPNLTGTTLYYRVRGVSYGGTTTYSSVMLVQIAEPGAFLVYPNPAMSGTAITLLVPASAGGQARLSLIDLAGQVVSSRIVSLVAGDNSLSWGLSNVGAGLYIVRIDMQGGSLYGRLVVAQIHAR